MSRPHILRATTSVLSLVLVSVVVVCIAVTLGPFLVLAHVMGDGGAR